METNSYPSWTKLFSRYLGTGIVVFGVSWLVSMLLALVSFRYTVTGSEVAGTTLFSMLTIDGKMSEFLLMGAAFLIGALAALGKRSAVEHTKCMERLAVAAAVLLVLFAGMFVLNIAADQWFSSQITEISMESSIQRVRYGMVFSVLGNAVCALPLTAGFLMMQAVKPKLHLRKMQMKSV